MKDKKEVSKIIYLFENQENNIKKIQQSIKIQKKNRSQYINFLEQKVKSLMQENKNLKKSYMVMNNNASNNISFNESLNRSNSSEMSNYMNSNHKNKYNYSNENKQNYYQNNYFNNKNKNNYNIDAQNTLYKTPNVVDRGSNLKKIEIKKSNEYHQSSIKYSPYINRYDENLNNVKNLNAQTAFEQQYSNKQGNNINVNINDNNSARRKNSFMNNISNRRSNHNSIERNYIKQNFGKNRYYIFIN